MSKTYSCAEMVATGTTKCTKCPNNYKQKRQSTTDMAMIGTPYTPQNQSLTRLQGDIPSYSLVSFTKEAKNTLQSKLQTHLTGKPSKDTVDM